VYYQPVEQVLDDVEHWCVPCMTMYPYEMADQA
jgi:hypothetical protein